MIKILLVDDEVVALNTLAEILRLEGYQVTTASTGEAAVEILQAQSFDLMVLDLKMPGMSGMEVLYSVVNLLAEMKVIVLTAHGSMESAIQALRFRVHDYMLKPVRPETVVESVKKALATTEPSPLETGKKVGSVYKYGELLTIDLNRRTVRWGNSVENLTPTEGRLMAALLEHPGMMVSHSDLVMACQGYAIENIEAAKILRPVVSRLRLKLARLPGLPEILVNVRGAGYALEIPGQ